MPFSFSFCVLGGWGGETAVPHHFSLACICLETLKTESQTESAIRNKDINISAVVKTSCRVWEPACPSAGNSQQGIEPILLPVSGVMGLSLEESLVG